MPENLVKKIDKQSRSSGSNRSDFIRQAVRRQLAIIEQWQAVSASARKNYSGKQLSEKQVADIVRKDRAGQTKNKK
ncbi:ribbon-helix-helix domain-containing protein [Candidatus Parcubacteria bacterium]|nr:ribbon-helix-helix domain-containing protein [Candidatus Parcubacteria bacterium]